MTDTTVTPAAPESFQQKVNDFFAHLKSDVQWFEADVIEICQNIYAGAEIALEDLQGALGFLGAHIGDVAKTVTAVQVGFTALQASGAPIPPALTSGLAAIEDATAGVQSALNNQAVQSNPSKAMTEGYNATKILQQVAAQAANILANLPSTQVPTAAAAS